MSELIMIFREVLEASLIIGILYTYLKKSENYDSLKMLWSGVVSAILLSILLSIVFQKIAGGFEGDASKIFEGIVMIIASIVLTTMIIWMARNKNISEELKNKAKEALSSKFKYGIFTLAFVAVLREGVEIILFLYAIGISNEGISIFPSLVGALLGLIAGYVIFIQGVKLPLRKFFNITSVFLIFVASGMFTYGVHELESGGVIPYYGGEVKNDSYPMIAIRNNGDSKSFEMKYNEGEKFIDCDDMSKLCADDPGWDSLTMGNQKWDIGEVYFDDKAISSKEVFKWASRIWDVNPVQNDDGSFHLLHDNGYIGGMFKGFLGYNGDPSLIEFVAWVISIIGLNILYYKLGKRKQ